MSVKCPDCTTINPSYKQRCEVCYKHLHEQEWRCQDQSCYTLNPISAIKCSKCGKPGGGVLLKVDCVGKEKRARSADRRGNHKDGKENVESNIFLGVGHAVKDKRSHSSDNRQVSRWNCCHCTLLNTRDAKQCDVCNHVKGPCCDALKGKQWMCHGCENLNLELFTQCSYCSRKRMKSPVKIPANDQGKKDISSKNENKHKKDAATGRKEQETKKQAMDQKKTRPETAQNGGHRWNCKRCGFPNSDGVLKCERCTHDKPRVTGLDFDDKRKMKHNRHDLKQSIRSKNLRTIKTIEVEREWRSIVQNCRQNHTNFIDTKFPPNDKSLFKNPWPSGSNIEWRRLQDITNDHSKGNIQWKVYDNPSAHDIMQGKIGNCWFICALAVVAERPKLVERIVLTKDYCAEGAYVIRLCKDGVWKTVLLDDYFPVDKHMRLKYSRARRGQLWVPLIEKAAAKIHGCYEALKAGRTVESLSLLTGEPCEHLSLTENKHLSKTIDNILIWSKLTHARDCGYLMCTSCGVKGGFSAEHCKSLGLITGHAYSLLDVYDLESGEKLLKVRNPWGTESWKGDWSDTSPKWLKVKPEVKQKLKPDGNKHGIFWIDFKDFRQYFGDIDICKTRDWHETRVKGSFPRTADGPWKFAKIYVPKKTDLCLGLHQKNKRGSSSNDDFVDMMIIVMEILGNGKLRTVGNSKRDAKSYVGCELELLESGEYIVSCLAFKHLNWGGNNLQHQLDFVLAVHSTESVVVEENDSVSAGKTHYLADTLIQLAVDQGKREDLGYNIDGFSLSMEGMIYMIGNKDRKRNVRFQNDCTNSRNLINSRGSAFTQDIIPPQ